MNTILILFFMLLLYITYNRVEGLDVPQRYLDDLAGDLEEGPSGALRLTQSYKDTNQRPTDTQELYTDHSLDAEMARSNFTDCKDSAGFAGCSITTPSPQDLSTLFVNRPKQTLNSSDIYNILPLCPTKYEEFMKTITTNDSQLVGQYPGYTSNDYLDKIRYIVSDQPLPVNPDFFAKDGGTY